MICESFVEGPVLVGIATTAPLNAKIGQWHSSCFETIVPVPIGAATQESQTGVTVRHVF